MLRNSPEPSTPNDVQEADPQCSSDTILRIALDGTIESVNAQVQEFLGYDPAEIVGKQFTTLVAVESRSHVFRMALHLREQPPSETREGIRAVFSLLCLVFSAVYGGIILGVGR